MASGYESRVSLGVRQEHQDVTWLRHAHPGLGVQLRTMSAIAIALAATTGIWSKPLREISA